MVARSAVSWSDGDVEGEGIRGGLIVSGVRGAAIAAMMVVLGMTLAAPAASAEPLSPWWHLTSGARPSELPPASEAGGKVIPGAGQLVVTAVNLGDAGTSTENAEGEPTPVVLADVLPAGLKAVSAEGLLSDGKAEDKDVFKECVVNTLASGSEVVCTDGEHHIPPYALIEVRIQVAVEAGATICEQNAPACGQNEVAIAGGGAPAAAIKRAVTVGAAPAPFGIEEYSLTPEEAGGTIDTRAGSHPFQTTLGLTLNQTAVSRARGVTTANPVALPKDLSFKLPPGLIGNPTPFARCTEVELSVGECPAASVLGVAIVTANEPDITGITTLTLPLYNLEPNIGEPARFGFVLAGETPVYIDTSVRAGSDYGITAEIENVTETYALLSSTIVFWGVPGAPSHDLARGANCLLKTGPCEALEASNPPPFFSLPTACTGQPLRAEAEADPWEDPGQFVDSATTGVPATLEGCNLLPFEPSVALTPDANAASSPTGFDLDVHVPQEEAPGGEELNEAAIKSIALALPPGVAIDPPVGDRLETCSEGLVGFMGSTELATVPGVSTATFTPRLPGAFGSGEPLEPGVNFCPNAAKIGTVTIHTPLLAGPLQGAVYLASQNANPFGSLIALYIVAEEPESGVLIELAGRATLNQETGQVSIAFENMPQLPLQALELHFFDGERTPLVTPARCGAYTTTAQFTPWSAEPGELPVTSSSTFEIASGPGGSPCPGASLPFNPSLEGGSTSIDAGAFSPLSLTISRVDGNQDLRSVRLHLPPGLLGLLANVPLCPEAQANAGTCGPASEIGETTISAGVGGDPVTIAGGRVYLTGPYNGYGACAAGHLPAGTQSPECAPFGLAIATPAKVGPFDLEHDTSGGAGTNNDPACDCVVVRGTLEVNPQSAALTIATDPEGPHSIPQIIDGVPLQIKRLNLTIQRPGGAGFIFNPTSCDPMAITGTITGEEGASAAVSTPFHVTHCTALAFKPKLTALTRGNGEFNGHGASLHVVVTSGAGQANLRALKLDLPQRLPARLETIRRACPESTFDANPAACPKASVIGSASVATPILGTELTGPAYLVSKDGTKSSRGTSARKGEAAFPDMVLVIQADGVRIDLTGQLYVDEHNITSVTFRAIPDVPIMRFDLVLAEGSRSVLAASSGLCKGKLHMSTAITGQNGAVVKPAVVVGVEGCGKAKRGKRRRKKKP
jgi:hypothetical protein